MVASLIVGTAVPSWDAAFVRALNYVIAGDLLTQTMPQRVPDEVARTSAG